MFLSPGRWGGGDPICGGEVKHLPPPKLKMDKVSEADAKLWIHPLIYHKPIEILST